MSRSVLNHKQRRGNEEMLSGFTITSNCEKVTLEGRYKVMRGRRTFQVKGMVSAQVSSSARGIGGRPTWLERNK